MPSINPPQRQTLDVVNIMESLVLEEVDEQLSRQISSQLAEYINRMEVATYALNRLPALYASSQEGLYYQVKRAKMQCREKIGEAVRRGIAAVLRDPIRTSTPLTPEAVSKVKVKLNLPPGDGETPVREIHHQTFADRRHKKQADESANRLGIAVQESRESPRQPGRKEDKRNRPTRAVSPLREDRPRPEPDDYKPDPRDLAYQAAQELRRTLQTKEKTDGNPALA